jgi:signal transduction histidine kinase
MEARAGQHGHVVVSVRDTGEGIPEDVLALIPALFKTTRKGGTGLGLMVALRIVREHGGTLAIASRRGEGTTVELDVPIAPAAA